MSMYSSIRASSLTVTMLAGWFAFATVATAAGNVESDQVSRILSDAKMQAFQLREDAAQLESFTRSTASWESHSEAIARIKEDVNKMGSLLTKLQDSRNGAAVWQQTAIDRVAPVAKELASNTTAAIERLNKNPRISSIMARPGSVLNASRRSSNCRRELCKARRFAAQPGPH